MVVWCAGGIDGASADTMEKEGLKEGWRRLGGYNFATPHEHLFSSRRS